MLALSFYSIVIACIEDGSFIEGICSKCFACNFFVHHLKGKKTCDTCHMICVNLMESVVIWPIISVEF